MRLAHRQQALPPLTLPGGAALHQGRPLRSQPLRQWRHRQKTMRPLPRRCGRPRQLQDLPEESLPLLRTDRKEPQELRRPGSFRPGPPRHLPERRLHPSRAPSCSLRGADQGPQGLRLPQLLPQQLSGKTCGGTDALALPRHLPLPRRFSRAPASQAQPCPSGKDP